MNITLSYKDFAQSARFRRIRGLLNDTSLTPKQVFTMAVQALDHAAGGMEHEGKYETEDFFEASVWKSMRKVVHTCLGICISYLVANQLVPLDYANKPEKPNKLYKLHLGIDPSQLSFKVS